MKIISDDLVDLEQYVNDRRRSSPPPDIPSDLIPETSPARPMLWVVLQASEVKILSDSSYGQIPKYGDGLFGEQGRVIYFPIHPLQLDYYRGKKIIESGTARISAAYRTFFYEPDKKGPVRLGPPSGSSLMLKLHLDDPLPGIQGDRLLTYEKVTKCLSVSRELRVLEKKGKLAPCLSILPEEIGLVNENRGVIVRRLPLAKLVPAFSLSSPDYRDSDKEILASTILRQAQETTGASTTDLFGEVFVKPLVNGLLSALRYGFSLEMHMQNVLFHFQDSGLVKKIFYRDLEGVIFSNKFRLSQNLPELFKKDQNPELYQHGELFRRYFNRNIDHDLGRIFDNLLVMLEKTGFFKKHEIHLAIKSTRRAVRNAIYEFGFKKWAFWNQLLRVSRTPYGNGTRPVHYYHCRFR